MTVVGADGTSYRLDIPEGALYAPAEIRMIPLAGLSGLPFGQSQPYAVQLEPDGLRLSDVAILTISPPEALSIEEQVFFSYAGPDHEFSFAAPIDNGAELQIMITHFSGYGVEKGLLADTEPLRARFGGDVERRIADIVARELGAIRQNAGQDGSGSDADARMNELLDWAVRAFIEHVLKPRLDRAGDSCAAGRLALQTLLGFERQMKLLGVATTLLDRSIDINALGLQVSEKCLDEEYELCRDEHIIHRIVTIVLGLMRAQELLGVEDNGALDAKGQDLIRNCLTFQLEFRSEIVGDIQDAWYYETYMVSKVDLGVNSLNDVIPASLGGSGQGIHGEAPLVNEHFLIRANNEACSVTDSRRGGSTLRVSQLAWDVGFRDASDEIGYVRDLSMVINFDPSTEGYSGLCGPAAFQADNSQNWSGAWGALHQQGCLDASTGTNGSEESTDLQAVMEALAGQGLSQEEIQEILGAVNQGSDSTAPEQAQAPSTSSNAGTDAGGTQYAVGACMSERGWDVKAGELFAVKEVELSSSVLGLSEDGTYVLLHAPR